MSQLSILLTTFNCARTPLPPNSPTFIPQLFSAPSTNTPSLPPDLLVLSLQELAPIAHSFLGGAVLAPYFARFIAAVNLAATQTFDAETRYVEVATRNVGMTGVVVLARGDVRSRVYVRGVGGVGLGWWGMGNKGAVGVRLGVIGEGEEEEVVVEATFVAAHLAPHEWGWKRRNEDWKGVCQGLVFEGEDATETRRAVEEEAAEPLLPGNAVERRSSLFDPPTHVFFAGDLNYRTSDTSPPLEAFKTWPRPDDSTTDWTKKYGQLFAYDQLTREKDAGRTLHNLAEAEIAFPPTYKYSAAAQQQQNDTSTTPWAKHRTPSWCDRILYLAAVPPQVHSYVAGPVQETSDHRPVSLSFSIPLRPLELDGREVKAPFAVRADWREARAAARRYEIVVGLAAYLTLTWEGEVVLVGSIAALLGGYVVLRAMLGT